MTSSKQVNDSLFYDSEEAIAAKGEKKIKNGMVVFTCGYDYTVLEFFLKAAETHKFEVMVAECIVRGNVSLHV